MTDYTITTNFGAKDSLPSGNAGKVIKGSEFTTEFTNIQTAVNTKADTAGDTFTGAVNFSADVAVNTNTLFVDVSEAKVGIGTTSPYVKTEIAAGDLAVGSGEGASVLGLEIKGVTLQAIPSAQVRGYIATGDSTIGVAGDLLIAPRTDVTASIRFITGTSPEERMRIDASGNLLVGTTDTTPYDNTTGSGICWGGGTNRPNSIAREATATCLILNKTGTQAGSTGIQEFRYDGTSIGTIAISSTAVTYNTGSDERLKENITDSTDAGSKVDAIQIRQFDWKADGSHQDYGVIAQELVEVAPEAVSEGDTEEDMMGVDYSKLVPMLIKEVQSLRSRVAELENV